MEGADFLKLEELILLAIAGRLEIYGLEIAANIATASADKVQLNYGSLYPYLNRLEKKGYITSRWEEENARKGARRKYYQITDKGTQSLDEARLIRQQLRQQSDVPAIEIDNRSQQVSDIERTRQLLQHPEEKERIRAIYRLEYEAKIDPNRNGGIMIDLEAFIKKNSPIHKKGTISPDIQAAMDVICKRKIVRSLFVWSIDLRKTNLVDANLEGANLLNVYFVGANLEGANLEGANLGGANLGGANLGRANLEVAYKVLYIDKANLGGTNLAGANLAGASLAGANLGGANLGGADLAGADLTKAWNLTIEQLHSARNWKQAIGIPDYLKSSGQ
jgi:DNA-binding PadR family transcriptional regulator